MLTLGNATVGSLHFGGWRLRQARVRLLRDAALHGRMPECVRCRKVIDPMLSGLHPDGATVGHRVPVSLGGDDSYGNLALEHRRCNLHAGAREAPPRASVVEPVRGREYEALSQREGERAYERGEDHP